MKEVMRGDVLSSDLGPYHIAIKAFTLSFLRTKVPGSCNQNDYHRRYSVNGRCGEEYKRIPLLPKFRQTHRGGLTPRSCCCQSLRLLLLLLERRIESLKILELSFAPYVFKPFQTLDLFITTVDQPEQLATRSTFLRWPSSSNEACFVVALRYHRTFGQS